MAWYVALGLIPVSALVGYFVGAAKFLREQKQKAYVELLPAILKVAYNPGEGDEAKFCQALSSMWLYADKDVALKIDKGVAIMHQEARGEETGTKKTEAFQEAVAAMRDDVQFWGQFWRLFRRQKIKPEEVKHIYSLIRRQ